MSDMVLVKREELRRACELMRPVEPIADGPCHADWSAAMGILKYWSDRPAEPEPSVRNVTATELSSGGWFGNSPYHREWRTFPTQNVTALSDSPYIGQGQVNITTDPYRVTLNTICVGAPEDTSKCSCYACQAERESQNMTATQLNGMTFQSQYSWPGYVTKAELDAEHQDRIDWTREIVDGAIENHATVPHPTQALIGAAMTEHVRQHHDPHGLGTEEIHSK